MLRNFLFRTILAAALAAGLPTARAADDDADRRPIPTEPPKPVTGRMFLDAAGSQTSIAAFRGKVVLLNFWATWCAPCLAELPSLDRLQERLGDEGLAVVAVSEDKGAALDRARALLVRRGLDHLRFFHDDGSALVRDLGVRGLPASVIIDRDGREMARLAGAAEWDSPSMVTYFRTILAP